ncbi:Mitotic spindle-associated MMXD complex subunit MIP18 [Entophlyctis sp. JEL0112]|nr:Mitotic spindle-associated MMXD complex subunit MIP18 [Entophlyctis sp. JEL0112]
MSANKAKDNANPIVVTPVAPGPSSLSAASSLSASRWAAARGHIAHVPDSADLMDVDGDDKDDGDEPIDAQEVFDLIRNINDPEHPLTLEQLNVAQLRHITVDHARSRIAVVFTPTIPHCSMATLIGLCIRVQLLRCLPLRFKVDIFVEEGTHQSEKSVNKQLNE